MTNHLFVINVAALAPQYLDNLEELPAFSRLIKNGKQARMKPVFPCLTLPCQASLTTGTYPNRHGIIANGFFDRDRLEVSFWDQYRSLLEARPFWERLKEAKPKLKTAVLCWQNTLYGTADIIVTPKPMHTDDGLIQWCYSKPVGLYEDLARKLGTFDLMHYWGPMASPKSSQWIMNAAISILKTHRPNLMMIYLPLLDYNSQRFGPDDPRLLADLKIIDELIGQFIDELTNLGIKDESTVAVLSEYSLSEVCGAIVPNLLLRRAGFLNIREIGGREYLDIEMSRAFAMVDHQIAHIYVENGYEKEVKDLLEGIDGVAQVLDKEQQTTYQVNHRRTGELLAITAPDRWFAYYWWDNPEKAPDFAHSVDIHRKPGYDALELFFDPEKKNIPTDTTLIRGSHGSPAAGGERMAVFLISGKGVGELDISANIDMVEVAPMLERLLL